MTAEDNVGAAIIQIVLAPDQSGDTAHQQERLEHRAGQARDEYGLPDYLQSSTLKKLNTVSKSSGYR